jgi:hypothetical protein
VAVALYEDYIYRGSAIVALLISFIIIAANNTNDQIVRQERCAMVLSVGCLLAAIAYALVVFLNSARF